MAFLSIGNRFFLAILLGFIVLQALLRPKWRLEELGLFLFAAAMSFVHMRMLALFVAFCAPLLVTILARWVPKYDRTKEMYALNAAIMTGIIVAMVWFFPARIDYEQRVEKSFPVKAVRYLDSHSVPGPMYNTYYLGGYLIFARGPEHKVFVDGRAEVYERSGLLADYVQIVDLRPGALALLQKYDIQSCLLQPDEALATVLAALPEWRRAYADDTSVLFIRQQTSALMVKDFR